MRSRLRAVCELDLPAARETAGLHEYDGVVQDLSPAGVARGLAALGGEALDDEHDEAHLSAFEAGLRTTLQDLADHRRNPLHHVANMDLAGYDRGYAPEEVRAAASTAHLRAWPNAVDMAIEALDRVPRAVADGLLGAVRGLAVGIDDHGDPETATALAAHARFVDHVARAAHEGEPTAALGGAALASLLGDPEGLAVDLGRLAERADAERDRLRALLDESLAALRMDLPAADAVAVLQADHPTIDGVIDEARRQTAEVIAFTGQSGLLPAYDGECRVGPTPPSRSWAMAMLSPAAPFEADGPSWYQVTPPNPEWPAEAQEEWLTVFSRAMLPAITVHEVAPGHFTHFRFMRRAAGDVRKALASSSFAEGWAHYVEELLVEAGFRDGDPRYAVGVAVEALIRVTRLAVSIGLHTGSMDVEEAIRRFQHDAFLQGSAARSEAMRATFDPGYGRYTWGKLEILDLRDRARLAWGSGYTHLRFHSALLALGSPPLGLLDTAITRG
jgi:hypothetical protein